MWANFIQNQCFYEKNHLFRVKIDDSLNFNAIRRKFAFFISSTIWTATANYRPQSLFYVPLMNILYPCFMVLFNTIEGF